MAIKSLFLGTDRYLRDYAGKTVVVKDKGNDFYRVSSFSSNTSVKGTIKNMLMGEPFLAFSKRTGF